MKRPLLITIICVTGYLSALFSFPQMFSPAIKKLGVFVPAIYGILVSAQFIACVGLWYFKRWGVQLYLLSFFAKIIFSLCIRQTGISFYVSAGFSVVFIIILLRFYSEMDSNL